MKKSNSEKSKPPDEKNPVIDEVTPEQKAAERARREERAKADKEIQAQKDRADRLEAQMKAADEEQKKKELAALEPQQRMERQIQELSQQIVKGNQTHQAALTAWQQKQRATELVAYRQLVLNKYGEQIIPSMVRGADEQEIDESAEESHQTYLETMRKAEESVTQRMQQNPYASQQQQYVPVVVAPPPNPYYVQQPQMSGYAGFPTVNNGEPVGTADGSEVNIAELTSEQAVRSGKYSGQLREDMLKQVRRLPGAIPTQAPRQMQPQVQYSNQPNGVMQPMGNPSGPIGNPQYQQYAPQQVQPQYPQPQYGPPQQQQVTGPEAAARAAIQRTHNGQNTAMGSTTGAAEALQTSQKFAQRNGIANPQAAFDARFSPSPPINSPNGGNG